MSIDALSARLQTERATLCAIVEGFNDRRVLTSWSESENLPVMFYCADEIEAEIHEPFRLYGGNKGRVITILAAQNIEALADKNAIGIVDRDVDIILGRQINIKGVYYTQYTCLFSQLLSPERVKIFLSEVFHRDASDQFIRELFCSSERMFRLRAEKQRLRPDAALPSFSRYVRKIEAGGFDWGGYLRACIPRFMGAISEDDLLREIIKEDAEDVRSVMHLHSTVDILWQLGRKERLFDNTVSLEELYRHLRAFYLRLCDECETAGLVRKMAQRLH